jgi:NADH dehydrogenase subunit A (EC 1.6.5.3)
LPDLLQYLPILLFLGVALLLSSAFVVLPMLAARATGAHKPNVAKLSEYECGFPAFEDPRSQFDVRFYSSRSCSSSSTSKRPSSSLGGQPPGNRLGRLGDDDDFPRRTRARPCYAWKKGALDWE